MLLRIWTRSPVQAVGASGGREGVLPQFAVLQADCLGAGVELVEVLV